MESDSELSCEQQMTLMKMLESTDEDTVHLAFSIIDQYPRPGIMINYESYETPCPAGGIAFYRWVRFYAQEYGIGLRKKDTWCEENKELITRLSHY